MASMKNEYRRKTAGRPHASRSDALESTFRFLARRDHACGELVLKLRRKGFSRSAIDAAVERCRELGYLDDAKTARDMAHRLAEKGYGPLRIRQALMQKGLEEGFVEQALAGCGDENSQVASARKVLQKKEARLRRESDPWKRRQIAYRYLAGRGFVPAVINQALGDI
jgi:regulatory protein